MLFELLFSGLRLTSSPFCVLLIPVGSQPCCPGEGLIPERRVVLVRVFWSVWSCLWGRALSVVLYDFCHQV